MTFHTRASSRCHHRFHFMAGIFQRPGSICIFKTLLMAWENCIFSVFLGTTLPTSSPTLWASASASSVPRNPRTRAEQAHPLLEIIWRPPEAGRAWRRVWLRWLQLWLARWHEARTPVPLKVVPRGTGAVSPSVGWGWHRTLGAPQWHSLWICQTESYSPGGLENFKKTSGSSNSRNQLGRVSHSPSKENPLLSAGLGNTFCISPIALLKTNLFPVLLPPTFSHGSTFSGFPLGCGKRDSKCAWWC